MGLISNSTERRLLKPGDHIYCYRKAHTYSHHGIYTGENRVIHFTRTQDSSSSSSKREPCKICGYQPKVQRGVVKSCLDCFLKRSRLFVFEYNVSSFHFFLKKPGTCSTGSYYSPDDVVRRATELLNGNKLAFGDYDLFDNNCECFAIFCKTGVPDSLQAFSTKATAKMAFEGLTEQPLSAKSVATTLYKVMAERKIDTLNHDRSLHQHAPTTVVVDDDVNSEDD